VTWGAPGAIAGDPNPAIHVADGSDGVNVGQRFDFAGTASFTLEGWMKIEPRPQGEGTFRWLFAKDYRDGGDREEYGIVVTKDIFQIERSVGTENCCGAIAPDPPTNPPKWTYVAATYDGASLILFVDGKKAQTTPDTRSQASKPVDGFIGANPTPAPCCAFGALLGVIDEFAIYDKALGPDRILAHFNTANGH
jgi:hypothetical protein